MFDKGMSFDPMLDNTEYKELKEHFDRLCDEQESLYKPDFEAVFKVLHQIDNTLTPAFPCTDNEPNLDEALRRAGVANDADFCKAFKRYNTLFVEGKRIQAQGLNVIAMQAAANTPVSAVGGWRFYPISIIAPTELMPTIQNILEKDATEGKGLFFNNTDFELEDEALDEYLGVDCYGLQCSFVPFLDELKQCGIVGGQAFLPKEFARTLFNVLKQIATFIKDNTDKPQRVKNHITKSVGAFDDVPIWGLFFQILTLQGLCRWLEGVNINEDDNGFSEAQSLYNWLCERLEEKEIRLCFMMFGDADKQQIEPLCKYLANTEIGKMVQAALFDGAGEPQQEQPQSLNKAQKLKDLLPDKLKDDEAVKIFQKTIDAQLVEIATDGLKWKGTKALCAYFADKASEHLNLSNTVTETGKAAAWKPFETVFGYTNLKTCKADWRKTGQMPKGVEEVDALFK